MSTAFSIFLNGLDGGPESTLSSFAGVTDLGKMVDRPDRFAAIQRDLRCWSYQTTGTSRSSSKGWMESHSCAWGTGTSTSTGLRLTGWKAPCQKMFWAFKLFMNKQRRKKNANSLLGCISQCTARKPSEVIICLCSAQRSIWLMFHYWVSQCRKDMNIRGSTIRQRQRAMKMTKVLGHLS